MLSRARNYCFQIHPAKIGRVKDYFEEALLKFQIRVDVIVVCGSDDLAI